MKIICSLLLALFCSMSFNVCAEEIKAAPALPEAKKQADEGKVIVLDVREKAEYDKGHLKNARHVPLSDLKAGKIPADLPKDKPIYTHCMKGGRATEAAKILNEKGYDAAPMKVNYEDITKVFEETK